MYSKKWYSRMSNSAYGAANKIRCNNTTDPCTARTESNPAIPHNCRKQLAGMDVDDA